LSVPENADFNADGRAADDFFCSAIDIHRDLRTPPTPTNSVIRNNAGFDIALFDLPNNTPSQKNRYITNDQTSTRFRYGTAKFTDSYMMFCMVLGLDAYIPEPELESAALGAWDKDGNPIAPDASGNYTVEPGARIDYEFRVRNRGDEPVRGLLIDFPFPQTTTLVENSLVDTYTHGDGKNEPGYALDYSVADARIVWKVPFIPVPPTDADRETVYASLKFSLKVTGDCNLLQSTNPACSPGVVIEGSVGGTGGNTGVSTSLKFVYGFITDDCGNRTPITTPPVVVIDAGSHNCPPPPTGGFIRTIEICTDDATQTSVPYAGIRGYYPGARFYTAIDPATGKGAGPEHTGAFTFDTEYYAVPVSLLNECYWAFRPVKKARPAFALPAAKDICQGVAFNLNDLVRNPQPEGITVRFFNTGADAASGNNPLPDQLTPATTDSRTLYARSVGAGGCNSEVANVTLTVLPNPEPGISFEPKTWCTGDAVAFDAPDEVPGAVAVSYLWEVPAGTDGTVLSGDTGSGIIIWTTGGQKEVQVTVTYENGCAGTGTTTVDITPRNDAGPIYRLPNED
jgi:hypothetical protein